MARRKVKLAYIINNSRRKTTYRKRKNGIIKKTDELTTLCGVEGCVIIYNEDDPQPEVWPSESKTQSALTRFLSKSELEQRKNKLDQESFMKQRILKTEEKVRKQKDENKKKEMINLLHQSLHVGHIDRNISMNGLNDLSSLIDAKLKEVKQRINWIESQEMVQNFESQTMTHRGEQANVFGVQGMFIQGDHTALGNRQGMVIRGQEQANLSHAQAIVGEGELQDVMKIDQQWSMDFINNNGDGIPFGDLNVPNGFWDNPQPL